MVGHARGRCQWPDGRWQDRSPHDCNVRFWDVSVRDSMERTSGGLDPTAYTWIAGRVQAAHLIVRQLDIEGRDIFG
jgi:hypothetical protein